ncbi:solute carrier family 35 member G5-like [Glandiceps talaboti]
METTHLVQSDGNQENGKQCCNLTLGGIDCRRILRSSIGVSLALFQGIAYAFGGLLSRLMSDNAIPPLQQAFLIKLTCLVGCLPLAICNKVQLLHEKIAIVLIISVGLLYTMAIGAYLYSLSVLPIGDATAVKAALRPILCLLGGLLFLSDPWKISDILGCVVNVAGVTLITQPTFIFNDHHESQENNDEAKEYGDISKTDVFGYVSVFVATVGFSGGMIIIRHLGKSVQTLTTFLYANGVTAIICLPLMFVIEEPQWNMDPTLQWYTAGCCITAAIGAAAMYQSVNFERVAVVSIIANIEIPVSYILQYFILGISLNILNVIGAVLIFLGSALIAMKSLWETFNKHEQD